ncbi:hypothetical protein PsYK624_125180 [Phanerochaete sordida]|uniref:F-box domain-containing protein n=1 Tax=Phanerochaete sordida TaxID=48140 RepID=A0A9P3LJ48_9APHY|nr:hypothetical protein PsYK624_125180 [Phanerochaete sordida]
MPLPAEIVDYVVDFLHTDIESLRSCTLVSKKWLPAGSFHLFSYFHWPPCDHQRTIWSRPRQPEGVCKCHLLDNSDTLEDIASLFRACSLISKSVRRLRISMSWVGSDYPTVHARITTPQQLATITDLAPQLSTLEIHALRFVIPSPSPYLSQRRSIKTLRLVSPSSNIDFQTLSIFLSHFSSVETLSVSSMMSLQTYGAAGSLALTPFIHVNNLDFAMCANVNKWFDFLSAVLDMPVLTSFSISPPMFENPHSAVYETSRAALHRFLVKCSNLRSLTCYGATSPALLSYPSACPTLREVRFVSTTSEQWNAVPGILQSQLTSAANVAVIELACAQRVDASNPRYRYLLLTLVDIAFKQDLGKVDWALLSASIARLRSLRVVVRLQLVGLFSTEEADPSEETRGQNEWRKGAGAIRAGIEAFIRKQLSTTSHQNLEVDVTILARRGMAFMPL